MESVNVNFDEHIEVQAEEPKKLDEYRTFVYSYEGMPIEEDVVNQIGIQQQILVSAESQLVNVKLHSEAELQNERNAQLILKIVHMKEMKNNLTSQCIVTLNLKDQTWKQGQNQDYPNM